MIGVILPSRGLIFSQTADEILQNVKFLPHKFFFAHGLPIPECFNKPLERALADPDISHIWFVEDDMVLPCPTLKRMLDANKAVVTIDYPINEQGRGAVFKVEKQVIFCGTGCLLVKREVFDELKKPYFRSDMRWGIKNYGDYLKMTRSVDSNIGYGLHDVNFCMNLYALEIPIHKLSGKLGQRKLVSLGKAGSNDGAHKIETWTRIKEGHLLKEVRKWPVEERGVMTTVMTPTGEITVSPSHANTLIDKGLATPLPKRALVVDWSTG